MTQLQKIIDKFTHRSRIPQAAGALDGTHIEIKVPKQNPDHHYL